MPVPFRRLILGTSLLLAPLAGAPSFAQTASALPLPPPATTTAVLPVELPAFQPGLWEYQRTVLTAADPEPAAAGAIAAAAAELPRFQPGLWEYRRTMMSVGSAKPQVSTVKKCGNPTADIQQKIAELQKKNCQFAAPRRIQDHYVSNWICPTPNGPARFHDVLTAKDATTYRDASEARLAQRVTRSSIEAVRLGDCPVPGAGVPGPRAAHAAPTPQR